MTTTRHQQHRAKLVAAQIVGGRAGLPAPEGQRTLSLIIRAQVRLTSPDRSFDRNEQHHAALGHHPANAACPRRAVRSRTCLHLLIAGSPLPALQGGHMRTERPRADRTQAVRRTHRPDEHHHSQHQPPSLPRCSAASALASTPPAVKSAPRVGTVVDQLVHGMRHRCGTDRLERGNQPESDGPRPARHAGQTHNAGPRSSGDRASVS
jgi:hypothetical protein